MELLSVSDVERLIQILAAAGDPTVVHAILERKRVLAQGVASLVNADVWMWSLAALQTDSLDESMALQLVEGGWRDDREKAKFLEVIFDPVAGAALQAGATEIVLQRKHVTVLLHEFVPADVWKTHGHVMLASGIEHSVFTFYPVDGNIFSTVGLHRRLGSSPFSDRDRAIVHLVFSQVEWLHKFGSNVPGRATVLELARRERQVLIYLMAGRTRKEIADCLELSEHTVGDYIKQLYKRFGVNSRGELLAQFIAGGQSS